jgi:hypothetical protein
MVHGVRLVHHAEPAAGPAKPLLQDPADAVVRVQVLLNRDLVLGAAAEAAAHPDVEALGVLAHDEQVDTTPGRVPKRTQAVVVEAGRPQVHIEVELEAQAEEHLGGIADVGNARIADGSEKDGVGLGDGLEGGFRHGGLPSQHRRRADLELLELVVQPRRPDYPHGLGDDLQAGQVTGDDCYPLGQPGDPLPTLPARGRDLPLPRPQAGGSGGGA